jgi:hypothetical protein
MWSLQRGHLNAQAAIMLAAARRRSPAVTTAAGDRTKVPSVRSMPVAT